MTQISIIIKNEFIYIIKIISEEKTPYIPLILILRTDFGFFLPPPKTSSSEQASPIRCAPPTRGKRKAIDLTIILSIKQVRNDGRNRGNE